MELSYFINENGSISIENIDVLKKSLGRRYSTYYFMTLSQAKRKHRKEQDLENVKIEWCNIN